MCNIQFLILASMVKEIRCIFLRKGSVFLLRLSSSIVSELWNRIGLLNDHRKCSHFAFEISSKRGSVGRSAGKSPPPIPPLVFQCHYCSFPNTKEPLYSQIHFFQKSTFPLHCQFTVPDLYLLVGPAIFHTNEFFHSLPFSCAWILPF